MNSRADKPPFYKRWAFWLALFMAALVLFVVIVVVTGSGQYSQKLADLKEKNLPTNIKELEAFYAIPEEVKDCTAQWVTAIESQDESAMAAVVKVLPYIGTSESPTPGDDWKEVQTARNFVTEQSDTYRLVREAIAADGAIRFDVDFSFSANAPLQQAQDLRQLTRLLCLDSAVAFEDADYQRVLDNILGIFRITDAMRYESTLMGQLIRNALVAIATEQTFLYVSNCNWNDEQLLRLQNAAATPDLRKGFQRAEAGERAFGLDVMDTKMPYVTIGNAAQLELIKFYELKSESMNGPWHEAISVHDELQAEIQSRTGIIDRIRLSPFKLLAPVSASTIRAFARSAARQRCTIAALAVERQRRQEGRASPKLTQIPDKYFPSKANSERFVDPFTDQSLLYITSSQAFTVYSVGEDKTDELGNVLSTKGKRESDVGFTVLVESPTTP